NNQRFGNSEYHGTGGELFVSELQTVNPLSRSFVKAGRELQIQHNDDFNGERQEGVGLYQVTQNRGRRWSSAKAFLESALDRPNLEVITDA
ncbi:GMC family oxidoreductase N-terminal domain-containing protein, partial [Acinetobacter baumannii]